jgi:cellulose synthase operon protein C
MKTWQHSRSISVLLVALALSACGQNDPQSLIASAKTYLAKNDLNAASVQLKTALQKDPNNAEARVLLAKTLLEGGDGASATTEVRKGIELKYPGDDATTLLARAMLLQRDYQKLISELGERRLSDPLAQADLKSSLAIAYLGVGDPKEARAAIDAAFTAKPQYPRALMAQAQLEVSQNHVPEALELIDAALAQTPDDMQALLLKADLQIFLGRGPLAVKTLERLVELRPDAVAARFALVTTLVRTGQVDIAAAQLDSLKKLAPQDVRTLYAEAVIAYTRGNMPAAREAIQQVLSVAPTHLPSLFLSGLVNYQMGSYAAAEEALRTVVAKAPENRVAIRALVSTYLRTGRTARAFETLEPVLQRAPNDPALLQAAAEVYLASNDPTKAAAMYERATALDKTNLVGQVRLAQVRLATGDADRAFKDLEAIAEANPALQSADLAIVSGHMRRHEWDLALAAAIALEKKQSSNPLVYNIKGVVYVAMRDIKNARASFEQALKLDPGYSAAAINLAQLDLAERNFEGARKRYDQILAKDPGNLQTLVALAGVLAASKAPEADVRAVLDRAIAANPASIRPRVILVGYYAQMKNPKAALAAAQAALAAFPDNAEILEILGAAQQAAGENNQALETFARAAKLLPQNPAPLLRLAGVQTTLKDYDGALISLNKALAVQPELTSTWLALATVYVRSGRVSDGIDAARKLQKTYPNRAVGYALEGQLLMNQKKAAEAVVAFREGLAREAVPFLSVLTYTALQSAGKPDQAAAMAQRWQKEHPKDIQLHTFQAQQSMAAKDYKAAMPHYQAILQQDPDNAAMLNNLAWALNELGDPKALDYAARAATLSPYAPTVIDTYGWVLVQQGDAKRGIELLRQASNIAPQDAEVRLHLAKALLKTGDKAAAKSELETLVVQSESSTARAEAQQMLKAL